MARDGADPVDRGTRGQPGRARGVARALLDPHALPAAAHAGLLPHVHPHHRLGHAAYRVCAAACS
eukprot:scaffold73962_cov68-Phaeocystis_antarctica.AAC.10